MQKLVLFIVLNFGSSLPLLSMNNEITGYTTITSIEKLCPTCAEYLYDCMICFELSTEYAKIFYGLYKETHPRQFFKSFYQNKEKNE